MIAVSSYIKLNRYNIYQFRIRIPNSIQLYLDKRELNFSLKTGNKRKAVDLARPITLLVKGHFANMHNKIQSLQKNNLSYDEIKCIVSNYFTQKLTSLKQEIDNGFPYSPEQIKWNAAQADLEEESALSTNSSQKLLDFVANEPLLNKLNLQLDKSSPEVWKLAREITKANAALLREINKYSQQQEIDYDALAKTVATPTNNSAQYTPKDDPKLATVVDAYLKEKELEGSWTNKTLEENAAIFKRILEILGNMHCSTINHSTARDYKQTITQLPPNFNKIARYRNKTIPEIIASKPDKTISNKTINKYLERVSSLFNWVTRHGFVEKNYFTGLMLKKSTSASQEREIFNSKDLDKLFSSKQYLTNNYSFAFQYWLPLLALFSGARMNELCSLYLEDIKQINGIWVFDINENRDKQLKTKGSSRIIPIHSKLIDLGLLNYVDNLTANNQQRLFAELTIDKYGTYKTKAVRWFSETYKKQCGITNSRKSFHSFRHTFADALKQQGISKEQVAALLGHADSSITFGRYGKSYKPEILYKAIQVLDFNQYLEKVKLFKPD